MKNVVEHMVNKKKLNFYFHKSVTSKIYVALISIPVRGITTH